MAEILQVLLKVHNLSPGNSPAHVRRTGSVNRGTTVSVRRVIRGISSKQQEIFFAFAFSHRSDLGRRKLFKTLKLNFILSRPGNSSWKRKDEWKVVLYTRGVLFQLTN